MSRFTILKKMIGKIYVNLIINNKLIFIDSFQSLTSSLNSLVKNSSKSDFYYLRQ